MNKCFSLFALCLLIMSSCVKLDSQDSLRPSQGQISISLSIDNPISTKAGNLSDAANDFIESLDFYEYDSRTTERVTHKRFENPAGIDLSTIKLKSSGSPDDQRTMFFFANLSKDLSDHLLRLDGNEISESLGAFIPLDSGQFKLDRTIMGGAAQYHFGNYRFPDSDLQVKLYRYVSKIQIKSVTAAFDDPELMKKNVELRRIAIINTPNVLRLIYEPIQTFIYKQSSYRSMINGNGFTGGRDPYFGGITEGRSGVNKNAFPEDPDLLCSLDPYGATGIMAGDHPCLLNVNYKKPKGVLEITATGDQKTATTHEFAPSTAVLCSSTQELASHTIEVNKEFYSFNWDSSKYGRREPIWSYYGSQGLQQKLVLEVFIDSKPFYYIICLDHLESGMIYTINNLTLRGLGSEYSNFYEQKSFFTSSPLAVDAWGKTPIDNIEMGFKEGMESIY